MVVVWFFSFSQTTINKIRKLRESKMYEPRFHIVLHQPEIPPNTGAIGRTCVALQAKLWLIRPLGFQVDEKTLRRAGLDYWQHLNWEVCDNWEQFIRQLGDRRTFMFTKSAARSFWECTFEEGDVLVFGCETSGLPSNVLSEVDETCKLRIPTSGQVRSLNLSNAAAVAGYELSRQLELGRSTE